jgi:hypothetical protein
MVTSIGPPGLAGDPRFDLDYYLTVGSGWLESTRVRSISKRLQAGQESAAQSSIVAATSSRKSRT